MYQSHIILLEQQMIVQEITSIKYDCFSLFKLGLLDNGKNHNDDYFGQYWDHSYLTQLLFGLGNKD